MLAIRRTLAQGRAAGLVFRIRGRHRRRSLRLHCRVRPDLHLRPLSRPTNLAATDRRPVSLLFGAQDAIGQTGRRSRPGPRRRPTDRLRFHVFSNPHQPNDYHFLCGNICRVRSRRRAGKLFEHGGRPFPRQIQRQRLAMGQPDLRRRHRRVRRPAGAHEFAVGSRPEMSRICVKR